MFLRDRGLTMSTIAGTYTTMTKLKTTTVGTACS